MVLCALLVFASCSKAPINNDPIIGIWIHTIDDNSSANKSAQIEENWIFNDAYLGRYRQKENNVIFYRTDFSWRKDNDVYIISYPGTDRPDDVVTLISSTILKTNDGTILAERE